GFSLRGERMLRGLLADRFKLAVHEEMRDLPAYALTWARSDRRMGPQMRTSDGTDCFGAGSSPSSPDMRPCGASQPGRGRPAIRPESMDAIVRVLQRLTGRIVVDRTGLTGMFSLDLEFAPLPSTYSIGPGRDVPQATPADDAFASFYTALQEQAGL